MTDRDAQYVLAHHFPPWAAVRQIEPLDGAGGWSGSRLWRVTAELGDVFSLRRFPEGDWGPRLALVRDVLARVFAGGLTVVPVPLPSTAGASAVEHGGRWWELTPWMPGTADFRAQPTRERLRAAMQTLARFHRLASSGSLSRVSYDRAPALIDRCSSFRRIEQRAAQLAAHLHPGLDEALDHRAARLLDLYRIVAPQVAPRVSRAAENKYFLQPAIRDIHRDHVLFRGDEVTGLVDFGAMRIDTPLADVARLVGSLVADDAEARRLALDAYSEVRPLSEDDRGLIDLLDESGLAVAAVNWLTWLYLDRRDMGAAAPIVQRLDEILARLERRR